MVHRAGLEPAIHRGTRSLAWRVFQFHHLCILALRERFERSWAVKHRLLSGEVPYQIRISQHVVLAQDRGVDPHNITVAHGFLDRFRGRPELSCMLEVPDRIERSIAELQSAAFAAWLRNHLVRKVRFELTRPFGHQGLSLTRLPFRHMRKWVQGWDSNPHITAYEAGVLPFDYPAI